MSASWPATALQLHPHVTVLVDPEAASRLARRDHYVETYEAKPTVAGPVAAQVAAPTHCRHTGVPCAMASERVG